MLFVEATRIVPGSARTRQELAAPGPGKWCMRNFKSYTVLEQINNEIAKSLIASGGQRGPEARALETPYGHDETEMIHKAVPTTSLSAGWAIPK